MATHRPVVLANFQVVRETSFDAKVLGRLRTLSWMKPDQLERLARGAQAVRIRRPDAIFPEGESSNRIFIMVSGVAKLSIRNRNERVLVGLVGPGEIFGVSSLLPHSTRPFRCDAFTDCTVAIVKPEAFVDVALGVPLHELSRVLDITVGRWWSLLIRYANFVGLGLRERLAGALLEVGAKFGVNDARGLLLTLKLTHEDLADLVGASRQRTTVQLKEFERERSLIRDGRRIIIVPEKLIQQDGVIVLLEQTAEGSDSNNVREQVRRRKRPEHSLPGSRNGG